MNSITPLEAWIAAKIGATTPLARRDLERWQLHQLNTTLERARQHSPFYRERLADCPARLTALGELALLPFTSAADLRRDPLRLLCVSQDSIERIITLTSSGTTGPPKRIAFTGADQELTRDFFHVGMSTFTQPGDRVVILLPGPTPGSVGALLTQALQRLGAEGMLQPPNAPPHATAQLIQAQQAQVLVATPSQAILLARHPDAAGIHLHSVLLTTDHVPQAIRTVVEQAWGCRVYNHYGMSEMGLGGGVECQAQRGYHVREADLLFEIVDAVSGQPLPEGAAGELVFTTLTRVGMPLIRYRTGDAGRFLPGRCPCGTTLRSLERVTHRLDGRIALADATLTMADLDEALFPLDTVIGFRATFTDGATAHLAIELELLRESTETLAQAAHAVGQISAIQRALNQGTLSYHVTHRQYDPQQGIALRKRIIEQINEG
ncbi:MAG: AMP-binding protein [Chloroflexaceae bacterium]|jgi:phenylacetate-coenzyme A ligase PaaK-like adenylate-forming protein|nr:AMP-binding protein [Chloroflexaceae bacterium]